MSGHASFPAYRVRRSCISRPSLSRSKRGGVRSSAGRSEDKGLQAPQRAILAIPLPGLVAEGSLSDNAWYNDQLAACDTNGDNRITLDEVQSTIPVSAKGMKAVADWNVAHGDGRRRPRWKGGSCRLSVDTTSPCTLVFFPFLSRRVTADHAYHEKGGYNSLRPKIAAGCDHNAWASTEGDVARIMKTFSTLTTLYARAPAAET